MTTQLRQLRIAPGEDLAAAIAAAPRDGNHGRDIVVAVEDGAGPLLGQNRAFVSRLR